MTLSFIAVIFGPGACVMRVRMKERDDGIIVCVRLLFGRDIAWEVEKSNVFLLARRGMCLPCRWRQCGSSTASLTEPVSHRFRKQDSCLLIVESVLAYWCGSVYSRDPLTQGSSLESSGEHERRSPYDDVEKGYSEWRRRGFLSMCSCLSRTRCCGRQMLASQKELHRNAIETLDIAMTQCVGHLFLFTSLCLRGLGPLRANCCLMPGLIPTLRVLAKIVNHAVVNWRHVCRSERFECHLTCDRRVNTWRTDLSCRMTDGA